MKSTVRVYINDKRIATGKVWKDEFLQVYPEKKSFASEAEWRTSIYESLLPTIRFVTTESPVKVTPLKATNTIVKPAAKKPVLNPEDSEEEVPEIREWNCGYCLLPPGNDHRMCICRGYNYSVDAWEKGRIFKQTKLPSSNSNSNPKLEDKWTFVAQSKASLPAGTYYIGDLCYALKESLYEKVFGPHYRSGYYEKADDPSMVFMMGATSDGIYKGSDGYEYPQDAGILGIASEGTLDPKKKPYHGGKIYTFHSPVSVTLGISRFSFRGNHYFDPQIEIINTSEYDETYEDSE